MKRIINLLFVFVLTPAMVFAQGSGTSGSGNSTSGNGSSSSDSGSGSYAASSTLTETTDTPEQQALEDNSNRGFIGGGTADGFVGVDEIYDSFAPKNSSNNRSTGTSASRRSTTRRSTSSSTRQGANRMGRDANTGTNNGNFVRAATKADFDYTPLPANQRISEMQLHLEGVKGLQNESVKIQNTPTGTVAVITGNVSTERERKLAKQLLLLEPGIDKVENNLKVEK
ncbi:hypothetical protein FACS189419_00580 [Planctomycetales bacterium]|nr:hypothetical protein FACS189419_00580 [Planctomycetales bacterium]